MGDANPPVSEGGERRGSSIIVYRLPPTGAPILPLTGRGFNAGLTRVRGGPRVGETLGFGELGRVILPARLSRFLTVVSGFSPLIRAVARVYHKAVPL